MRIFERELGPEHRYVAWCLNDLAIGDLARGKPEEALGRIELSPFGLHWPDLDEDLSLRGVLAGDFGQRSFPRRATTEFPDGPQATRSLMARFAPLR